MESGEPTKKPVLPAPKRRRWLRVLVSLIGLAILWVFLSRTTFRSPAVIVHRFEVAASDTNAFLGVLRIGAYNIAHGRGAEQDFMANFRGSKEERLRRLRDMAGLLRSNRLDVVVLNEVDFSAWGSHSINQARVIAKAAGFSWCLEQSNYDVNYVGFDFHAGNAILSRYPLKDAELIRYPHQRPLQKALMGFKRGAICTVELPDETEFKLVAVHLDHENTEIRIESVKLLQKHTTDSPLPVVFAGDFNSEPGTDRSALDRLLNTHRHRPKNSDADDLTWPSARPTRALDWVLVPPEWTFLEKSQAAATHSDHRLVVVEVAVAPW